jgi:hypothetical protein
MLNKTAREQVAVDMRFRGIIYLEVFKKDATNPNRILASRINLGGVIFKPSSHRMPFAKKYRHATGLWTKETFSSKYNNEPAITIFDQFHFTGSTFFQQSWNAFCACSQIFHTLLHLANASSGFSGFCSGNKLAFA